MFYCLYKYIIMLTRACVIIVGFFLTLDKAYCIVGNGGWSNWTRNSTCSVACGGGIQLYTRSCTNPPPNVIGASCVGESYYEDVCNESNCVCKFITKRTTCNIILSCNKTKFNRMLIDNGQWRR